MNRPQGLDERALSLLACKRCHSRVVLSGPLVKCRNCGEALHIRDGVLVGEETASQSYFDEVYEVMRLGNHAPGTWDLFYKEQAEAVERTLHDGEVVIDVGCGPELLYKKNGTYVVGVDASYHSVRANEDVDLRLFASAAELPLADSIADAIVCFYSIHHMTGNSVIDNREIVAKVFREFARVLRPKGRLMIFDVSPWSPFGTVENLVWNTVRRWLGRRLDMFFWKARALKRLGKEIFPGASFSIRRYGKSPFRTFPPIFSKPSIRVPRLMYPFDINLYVWQRQGAGPV